jgi:hypothetical protein
MKKEFLALVSMLVIFSISCNSQNTNDAVTQANDVQKMVKENSPGYTSASAEYYMKAKINGKDWAADEFMVNDGGGIVGQTKDKEHIRLPFELRYAKEGEITNFQSNAADIYMNDDVKIWGGHQGKMMFTKVGNNYAEGKFYITGTSQNSDKKLLITEGTFRIPITGK